MMEEMLPICMRIGVVVGLTFLGLSFTGLFLEIFRSGGPSMAGMGRLRRVAMSSNPKPTPRCPYCGCNPGVRDKCCCCGAHNPDAGGTITNPGEEKSRPSSGWNRPVPVS